ncbi:MAG: glucosyl-3-phosphoglycerate synthase [Nitriliruptoraceae bacterium]
MSELLVLTHTPLAGLSAWAPVLHAGLGGPWRAIDVPSGQPLPRSLEQVAGLVLLGGTMSAVEPDRHPWMRAEQALLTAAVEAEIPVLGVCLGAQLLGRALGGTVRRRPTPEVAAIALSRTAAGRRDAVVGAWPDGLPALFVHEDEVATLPSGAVPLLRGSDGVSAWRLGSAVAVQFHPEVDAATLAAWIGDPTLRRLLAPADPAALLARWQAASPAVVGAGRGLLRRFLTGPVASRRQAREGATVPGRAAGAAGPAAVAAPPGPPVVAHQRWTAADLRDRCRAQGRTVSVILPARNEAATVGRVVEVVRTALQERVDLVDELVVVDADSTDATADLARAAGATVVTQGEVLPELGTAPGKGEAMWKGLAATTGDLVVYLDADVADLEPHFVVGLLGPLLEDPGVQLTKAVYDRRLALDGTTRDSGGGRVTELLARPALTRWFPALAGLAQPLAGEVAARRELLVTLPFVRGYGVEVAMLIDVVTRAGVGALAQVDLGRRTHDHQELPALGRMAAELLEVIVQRREALDAGREPDVARTEVTLWQPARDADGRLQLERRVVGLDERPPLRTVPGHGRRHPSAP